MPRFNFDVWDGTVQISDADGTDYADRMDARNEAMGILSDLGRNALPDGDHRTFAVNVRDERRVIVYAAKLMVSGRWLAD